MAILPAGLKPILIDSGLRIDSFNPRFAVGGPIVRDRVFLEQTAQMRWAYGDLTSRPETDLDRFRPADRLVQPALRRRRPDREGPRVPGTDGADAVGLWRSYQPA